MDAADAIAYIVNTWATGDACHPPGSLPATHRTPPPFNLIHNRANKLVSYQWQSMATLQRGGLIGWRLLHLRRRVPHPLNHPQRHPWE